MQTRNELRQLIAGYHLSGLQWTDRVVAENWAIPHSHPIVTMNTRTAEDDLLAAYLHEQLHRRIDAQPSIVSAADATRQDWPRVPDASVGGAADEHPIREHLILCHLEQQALRAVIGPDRADTVLRRQMTDVVYPWVYAQILPLGPTLDRICTSQDPWPARVSSSWLSRPAAARKRIHLCNRT